jgi:membrane associated rhomboid family serine protease
VPAAVSTTPSPSTERTCYRHPDRRAGVICQRCDRPICPDCMKTASVGFHCPECTKQGKQKVYTRANIAVLNRPVLTQIIIAINVAVFVAGLFYESSDALAGEAGGFTRVGGLLGDSLFFSDVGLVKGVAGGEWWRIVTGGFLHAGLIHIGFNMYLLYMLGSILEPALGRLRFGAIYLTSLLCGSLGVLLISPDQITVGASGAVFGLMGALFYAQRAQGIDPFSTGIGTTIGINLLLTFTIPGISIGGHIGGLVGGLLSAYLLYEGGRSMGKDQALAAVVGLGVVAAVGCVLVA